MKIFCSSQDRLTLENYRSLARYKKIKVWKRCSEIERLHALKKHLAGLNMLAVWPVNYCSNL